MNNKTLTTIALRYRALFLDINREDINMQSVASAPVIAFVARLKENGFSVSEELLHALNTVPTTRLAEITECINEVMGTDLNWTPLVKGWNVPTGETFADSLITFIVNVFGENADFEGTRLPCGHLIPKGTFPLERYNGCPFCGTPFKTSRFVYKGQGSSLKELRLFTLDDMMRLFASLLTSATPLDGSQKDSLMQLLREFPLPDNVHITMKETAMLVIKLLVEQDKANEAMKLLKTPTDILRYLWYEKTGSLQIIEPKTLITHAGRLYFKIWGPLKRRDDAAEKMKRKLKLKYDRKVCQRVARWMNALPMTARQAAENMNPKHGMWVRMIHALRLGEYSRKKGFKHLAEILDVFYKKDYTTWQGRVDKACRENDADTALTLLKERPGVFSRCLYSTILHFGLDKVITAFSEITDKLPARLLLSLGNAADSYFDPSLTRIARPITGIIHKLEANKLLQLYDDDTRIAMAKAVYKLYRDSMAKRFAAHKTDSKTIYIDPALYNIPVSVGDRATTIQDTSCALMGTRFPIEGDNVRLFMHWGTGLPAQFLDMDLSAVISFPDNEIEECDFSNLTCTGAQHSGDFLHIPDMVGTAEYIELSLPELEAENAQYVTFCCSAYSEGALPPNLKVGWMSSAHKMEISCDDGVAYDPSCVQHFVRVDEGNLSKDLVFGVLDVAKREIVWMEMPFCGQTVSSLDSASVKALLHKLESKLSIGQLLDTMATAQNLTFVENPKEADEVYTYEWALNPAEVTKLLCLD